MVSCRNEDNNVIIYFFSHILSSRLQNCTNFTNHQLRNHSYLRAESTLLYWSIMFSFLKLRGCRDLWIMNMLVSKKWELISVRKIIFWFQCFKTPLDGSLHRKLEWKKPISGTWQVIPRKKAATPDYIFALFCQPTPCSLRGIFIDQTSSVFWCWTYGS